MSSVFILYLSIIFQIVAAVMAIGLVSRTKYNSSWILISIGFIFLALILILQLFPTLFPNLDSSMEIVIRWLSFTTSLLFLIGVFFIRKLFQFLSRVDKIRDESEKRILSAVIKTEEQERQRFAKELHDGLGPLLSVMKMLLSALDKNEWKNELIMKNLTLSLDEAIDSVREISANISPHILNNFGLHDAVNSFIKRISQNDNLKVNFSSNIKGVRFPYNTEVVMYRVVCELINNTLRHSGATELAIDLNLDKDYLYLDYSDNGIGFDVAKIKNDKGMGLENMRYRLQSGNGGIEIESEHKRGMRAKAYIKVEK